MTGPYFKPSFKITWLVLIPRLRNSNGIRTVRADHANDICEVLSDGKYYYCADKKYCCHYNKKCCTETGGDAGIVVYKEEGGLSGGFIALIVILVIALTAGAGAGISCCIKKSVCVFGASNRVEQFHQEN